MSEHRPGTSERPLRVAVVGSGPSGFYATEHLQSRDDTVVQVDMFDRLPTPFGLVRGGVAPDHQKIKSVTRVYDRIAAHPEFRFYGNVELGRDLAREDLQAYYHAVIYAVGARTDRRMGIPREHLPGSHSATEFVGWYNAHPDFRSLSFDLTDATAVVVGNGNVAMDVARILASSTEALAATDIADDALHQLTASAVREIRVLGRRGPAEAAFTSKELRELADLPDVDVVVDAAALDLPAVSREEIEATPDRNRDKNIAVLEEIAARPEVGHPTRIVLEFLASPTEILGVEHVEGVRVARNELYRGDDGAVRARPTDDARVIETSLIFRAIGYQGVPLVGVPFDAWAGVIPNDDGRVVDPETSDALLGEYVVGWIKRGPQGIIGTNKPDARETVDRLFEDLDAGALNRDEVPGRTVLERLIGQRRRDFVSYEDWQIIDAIEQERAGESDAERPRRKFGEIREMLSELSARKDAGD